MTQLSEHARDTMHLSFLYKRLSMNRAQLGTWLFCDDFVDAMNNLISSGVFITDEVVLPVIEEIYAKMQQLDNPPEYFWFRAARQSINRLRRAIESKSSETTTNV